MGVEKDQPLHVVRLECDGKPSPMACMVADEAIMQTRDECNAHLFSLGWRLHGKRTLCRYCSKRELEAKEALQEARRRRGA